MDKCWKIHDYPPKFKNNSWKRDVKQHSKAHIASNEGTNVQEGGSFDNKLTQQQYSQLMTLLSKQQTSASEPQEITHVSNSTQLTGKTLFVFDKSNWIIDFGATDHICSQYELFDSCETPNNNQHVIVIPNGKRIKVNNAGVIKLPNGIILKNVLHIPDFQFNLLSLQKLAKDVGCNVFFTSNNCYMQEHLKAFASW